VDLQESLAFKFAAYKILVFLLKAKTDFKVLY